LLLVYTFLRTLYVDQKKNYSNLALMVFRVIQ